MARPPKPGPKKKTISVSVIPQEQESVNRTAAKLGFANSSRYFLALHEAAHRLGLHVKPNFDGERWFVLSPEDPVPEDFTVERAIIALLEDKPEGQSAPYAPRRIRGIDTIRAGQSANVKQSEAAGPQVKPSKPATGKEGGEKSA